MDAANLQTYASAALDVVVAVGGLVAARIAPQLVNLFAAHTGIKLTAQQQETLSTVAHTVAGVLEAKVRAGVLKVADVHIANPQVVALAQTAIAMAPMAAAQLGVTEEGMAAMIVGRAAQYGNLDRAAAAAADPATAPTPAKAA